MPICTILVEDSATIRESLMPAMVELAHVEFIAVAQTAAEGIAAMIEHGPNWDLAVVDMFLSEGNGLEVVRAAASRQPHQRVVVFTNYATKDIRQKSSAAGADAIFDKSTEIDLFFGYCSSL